jgi:hypothetical protein
MIKIIAAFTDFYMLHWPHINMCKDNLTLPN